MVLKEMLNGRRETLINKYPMSTKFKQLEDVFDMAPLDAVSEQDIEDSLNQAKDLEEAFKHVDGFETHDEEMDELAGLAIKAHKDLIDLGMNVEVRHAGEIFSTSSSMLKIAVDAKNNKVEKKLKLLKLKLDKLKLDRTTGNEDDKVVDGDAVHLDFNELLEMARQKRLSKG
jgi:hypothetical protein